MSCGDLCTAAKCAELEARIGALEQALALLEASFGSHVQQDIPQAHNYQPQVNVSADIFDGTLAIDVAVGDESDIATVDLPLSSEHVESNLRISASFQSEVLTISVADGESQDTAQVQIPLPSVEPPDYRVNVSADIFDGTLAIDVAVGDESDIATVNLPSVEIDMNCDEISDELRNLRNIIIAEIEDSENNLNNKIEGAKNELSSDLINIQNGIDDAVKWVTVDISETTKNELTCKFTVDDAENFIPTYAESNSTETNYTGVGLVGIHENLKLVSDNLIALHADVCKAIEPISSIKYEDLYQYCSSNKIQRSDFATGDRGDAEYEAAKAEYLRDLLAKSKYDYLVKNVVDGKLITAPNNWITPILADFALVQGKINNTAICALDEKEDVDVVAITALDKVIGKHQGKNLVLHLVTFNNYPKRARNSSYWQQQIPKPKSEYKWNDDFLNIVWNRGNLYCELYFKDIRDPVSGWFLDKESADVWFNSILKLTTATERNRKYHEQKTPARQIVNNVVRPYRAFITSVSDAGLAVCHVKYVPPTENERAQRIRADRTRGGAAGGRKPSH